MFSSILEIKTGYSGWLTSAADENGDAVYAVLNLAPAMEVQLVAIKHKEWHLHLTADNGIFSRVVDESQASQIRVRPCQHCWMCGACHAP